MPPDAQRPSRGEIITFYSYKGGTGRTMALANVACLLADRIGPTERVLAIDWDLEAPGLHRFFPGRLGQASADSGLGLDASEGLIDLFGAISRALPPEPADSESASEAAVEQALSAVSFDRFIGESGIPRVHIMRAGRNDDGQYSKRVNTFNWEDLFRREPTIYRRVTEHLAERFRYVLIDSRTGVTDISGICSSLLPEKLIVVFTPNRQSLTGIRELVERATAYRRSSDDLRPLLIYPLPSRIEASLQELREQWRFGSQDHNLTGYQPMFEELFANTYGLERCDLDAYFTDVQIQQTPDYAYGEEIAVRRGSDRFSLANSYRVFVDRLGDTPWVAPAATPLEARAPAPQPASSAALPSLAPNKTDAFDASPVSGIAPAPPVAAPARPAIFLAYAREDRERVTEVADRLREKGWGISSGIDIPAGSAFNEAVADAMDASSVVVVFWSATSVKSSWIREEASEGLRRGILVPVLLDEVAPPLAFRGVYAADLRRPDRYRLQQLIEAVERIAEGTPGATIAQPTSMAAAATRAASPTRWALIGSIAAALVLVAMGAGLWTRNGPNRSVPAAVTVPDFTNAKAADAQTTAGLLGVTLVMRDTSGKEFPFIDGIVKSQSVEPGTPLSQGQSIELVVSASYVAVPTVVGKTVEGALAELSKAQLSLGSTTFRRVTDAAPGMIIDQKPGAGENVATGSRVDVSVATRVEAPSSVVRGPSKETSPPNQQQAPPPIEQAQRTSEYGRQRELMLATVQKYKAAYDSRSMREIVALYPTMSPNARARIEESFKNCRKYTGQFDGPQVATRAGEEVAIVKVTWTYNCERTFGEPLKGKVPQTFQVRPSGDGYIITNISEPLTPK